MKNEKRKQLCFFFFFKCINVNKWLLRRELKVFNIHHLEPSFKALHAALSDAKKVLLGTLLVQAEKRKTLGCNLRQGILAISSTDADDFYFRKLLLNIGDSQAEYKEVYSTPW